MSESKGAQITPVLLKSHEAEAWPEDETLFYLVARDGLYICRNHEFFSSCVPARGGPSELEEQPTFMKVAFPPIPQALFERIVGFFARIADLHSSEAAVVLVWDREERRVRIVVPEQVATVSRGWQGHQFAIGVDYTPPSGLPSHWVPFGDVHCHVHHSAYASHTDKEDETHAAGLHIVVGRIDHEPPDLHAEAVVDGVRFSLDADRLLEGYEQRDLDVPQKWIERVKVEAFDPWAWGGSAKARTS